VPSFHQIGALALHLAKNECWWIQVVYADRKVTEEERMRFHLDDDTTETDFALRGYRADDCLLILAAAHDLTISTLTGVSDTELETTFPYPRIDPSFQSSLRWIIHHLIDHEATHKGQIAMMKRLIRE
jgi:uncharacterized damage-inducible protein DinB